MMVELIKHFNEIAGTVLFSYGEHQVSVARLMMIIIFILAFIVLRARLQKGIERVLKRSIRDTKQVHAASGLVNILLWIVGIIILLDLLGIGITSLFTILAALGVGIGFGLQNLVNNVIGGIILLFERPIRVGDVVRVNNQFGMIQAIGWRATRIVDLDNIEVLLPNSVFIDGPLENCTLTSQNARFSIGFGVRYDSDRPLVRRLALQAAQEHELVKKAPAPVILLSNFGDSSIDYTLSVWTDEIWRKNLILGEIRERLFDLFAENHVQIPFPQRDIHVVDPVRAEISDRQQSDNNQ